MLSLHLHNAHIRESVHCWRHKGPASVVESFFFRHKKSHFTWRWQMRLVHTMLSIASNEYLWIHYGYSPINWMRGVLWYGQGLLQCLAVWRLRTVPYLCQYSLSGNENTWSFMAWWHPLQWWQCCCMCVFSVNVGCGQAEERVLLTGLHAVADIYCECCKTTLGWKYVSTPHKQPFAHVLIVYHALGRTGFFAGGEVIWLDFGDWYWLQCEVILSVRSTCFHRTL